MRILILTIISILVLSPVVSADSTGEILDDPLGLGVDVKVVDFDTNNYVDSINLEVKRDVENNVTSGFLVLKLDVSDIFETAK